MSVFENGQLNYRTFLLLKSELWYSQFYWERNENIILAALSQGQLQKVLSLVRDVSLQ